MKTTLMPVNLKQPVGRPRGQGIHISTIIRCMAVEMGVLDPSWVEDMSLVDLSSDEWWEKLDPPTKLRMSLGLAWEQWYVQTQLEGVIWQPGEMCVNGIYMNHDGEELDVIITPSCQQFGMVLHEIKTTSKSTNTVGDDLLTQWMWLAQMKAYCKGLNTLVGYLHVLFLRGNYKWPYNMEIKRWRVEFTQEEIDMHWEDMMDYVRYRESQS
jgi:hypothetical protein